MSRNFFLLSMLALAFGHNAYADGKGYAGAACTYTSSASFSSGRYLNGGSSSITVTCPLVNDVIGSDYVDTAGIVWFMDQSATAAVSCTQYSRYQTSSSLSGYSAAGSYPSGSGSTSTYTSSSPTKMTFSGTLNSIDVTSVAGWHYFSCSIPAVSGGNQSGIVAYHAQENP